MQKSIILFLFMVAVFVSLKKQGETNKIPNPRALAPSVYLYGLLALSADFLEGLPVVIAAMLTVALIWRSNSKSTVKSTPKKTVKPPAGPIGPIGG